MTEQSRRPDGANPLADALSAAERSPEALSYEVPVALVRARARRRRGARTAGAAGVLAAVVAGVAVVVPQLTRSDEHAVADVAPDAPALCGWTTAQLAADDGIVATAGDASTDLWVATATVTAAEPAREGPWHVAVESLVDAPTADLVRPPAGGTIASSVVVLRDGAVVGVLDGTSDMSLAEASRVQVDWLPREFPVTTELDDAVVSCATGRATALEPGDYELVATTTVAWDDRYVARSTSEPFGVTVPGTVASDDPTSGASDGTVTCGGSDEALRTLADPRTNPAPLRVELPTLPASARSGEQLSVPVSVTNDGAQPLHGSAATPTLVLVRDGTVVGGLDPAVSIAYLVDLEPGESTPLEVGGSWLSTGSLLRACTADGNPGATLEPGAYDVWVVVSVIPDDAAGNPDVASEIHAAGGPVPLTLEGPTGTAEPGTPPTSTDKPIAPAASFVGCGTDEAMLQQHVEASSDLPLAIVAHPSASARPGSSLDAGARVENRSDAHVASAFTGYGLAHVVRDGVVVATYQAMPEPQVSVDLDPGESQPVMAGVALEDCTTSSRPGAGDGEPLAPGTYDVWVEAWFDSPDAINGWHVLGGPATFEITG